MGGLPVYVVVQGAVWISGDANIKERDLAVFFYFHRKLDVRCSLGVVGSPEVRLCHVAIQQRYHLHSGATGRVRGFKLFHENVSKNRG